MFDRILLAVDSWDRAKGAVAAAVDLAAKSRGEVLIMHVHGTGLVSRETVDLEEKTGGRRLTAAAFAVLAAKRDVRAPAGLRVAQSAGVARQILHEAEAFGADTIVLGSRGPEGFTGLPLGSVAHRVIQRAECPVVVAPVGAQHEAHHARVQ